MIESFLITNEIALNKFKKNPLLATLPKVIASDSIVTIFELMKKHHTDIPPVYNGGELIGIIRLIEITEHFLSKTGHLWELISSDIRVMLANLHSIFSLLKESGHKQENKELIEMGFNTCKRVLDNLDSLLLKEMK